MKAIETIITVGEDRRATLRVPDDVLPGEHHAVIVVEQNGAPSHRGPIDIPVDDVGPWPENLSLRREDMYGDDGR